MYPWLRLLRVGASLRAAPKVPVFSATRVRLRVWPGDLDLNLHVNNGRYLSLADLGRLDWLVRTGLYGAARTQKASPVIGDAIAKFRRDLQPFQTFEIHTRLLGWDSKWGFIEHRFMRAGRAVGVIAVRGVFKHSEGLIQPAAILESLGHTAPSPVLPEWATEFDRSASLLSESLREEERLRGLR